MRCSDLHPNLIKYISSIYLENIESHWIWNIWNLKHMADRKVNICKLKIFRALKDVTRSSPMFLKCFWQYHNHIKWQSAMQKSIKWELLTILSTGTESTVSSTVSSSILKWVLRTALKYVEFSPKEANKKLPSLIFRLNFPFWD